MVPRSNPCKSTVSTSGIYRIRQQIEEKFLRFAPKSQTNSGRTQRISRRNVALVPNVTILEPTPDNWKVCRRIARGGGDRRRRLKQEEGRKETGFR